MQDTLRDNGTNGVIIDLTRAIPSPSPNPRVTKLFINTYSMLREVRTLEGATPDLDTLALWTVVRVRWPSIADFLQHKPDAVKGIREPLWCSDLFPEELLNLAKSEDLRAVVCHTEGGPLTADAIRSCCGTG